MGSEFDYSSFNIISDDQYYYAFRALEHIDMEELEKAGGMENLVLKTYQDKYPENDKYKDRTNISLSEIWDHIRINFYQGTKCVSTSSNANIALDYGAEYNQKYVMFKIPKDGKNSFYLAGQYMMQELNKKLDEAISKIPEGSKVLEDLKKIDEENDVKNIKSIIGDTFKECKSKGNYVSKIRLKSKNSIMSRFYKKQGFNEEQELMYHKLISKLTLLEMNGYIHKKDLEGINISSLIATIGGAFSSREIVHYGEVKPEQFMPVSRANVELFALIQAAKEQGVDEKSINQLTNIVLNYTKEGYELKEQDGKLYYTNGKESIDLDLPKESIINGNEDTTDNDENNNNTTIERLFESTKGTISYKKAKKCEDFIRNYSIARQKTRELTKVLKTITNDKSLDSAIDEIEEKTIAVNSKIMNRVQNKGIMLSESVNIDINGGGKKDFSIEEQKKIQEYIDNLSDEQLNEIIENNNPDIEKEIFGLINSGEEKSEERYYVEIILDNLDIDKIYKNAVVDKNFNEEERERILGELEKADCKRLINAFISAGVEFNDIPNYIINLYSDNGFKNYSFEELSKLENLDEVIKQNISNNSLKGHVYAATLEKIRGNVDDKYQVEDTEIRLRDYQKETVDNIDHIYNNENKRFAGVVLPTGAGKSFIAMTEMLKNKNGNIIYIAPQNEILNQVQRHILKNICGVTVLTTSEIKELKAEQNVEENEKLKLPEGKILPSQINEYIKTTFPHLKMYCYQGLKDNESDENELKDILKNADADLIVLDELHRSGANTWKKFIQDLIDNNKDSKILGITATPIRDVDHVDMMKEIAIMTGDYTPEELSQKKHLAYEMYLIDAIQRGLVVEPEIVSFDFMLAETDEYKELDERIKKETDPEKLAKYKAIKNKMDNIIYGDIDEKGLEKEKKKTAINETEQIGKIINATIKKKDGKYIVFIPHNMKAGAGLDEIEYFKQYIETVKGVVKDIDDNPEISILSSKQSKTENYNALSNFENSNSEHLKLILAIDKLNEGVHVDGINGEIMYRKVSDGSKILYLQLLGRAIYSLDPDNPVKDEDIPVIYDIYNNYLVQHLDREVNHTTPKSDLQRLEETVEWLDKHGYDMPDINSKYLPEARKAVFLKKIQKKYGKFINGIDASKYNEAELEEISKIMEISNAMNLFDMDLGERIIPPGEKELGKVNIFNISAKQKKFSELYKEVEKVEKGQQRVNNKLRLNRTLNVLEAFMYNDINVNNDLIELNDTLEDVINKLPEEYRDDIREELYYQYDKDYPIGEEYNYAKYAFRKIPIWRYYDDKDIVDLYHCGIFERVQYSKDFITNNNIDKEIGDKQVLDSRGFIIWGPKSLKHLNVKTGTYLDENGNEYNQEQKDEKRLKYKRVDNIYNLLEILYENGIEINNNSIKPDDKLEDVLNSLPKETKDIIKEKINDKYEMTYPVGEEYNYAKYAFMKKGLWEYYIEKIDNNEASLAYFQKLGLYEKLVASDKFHRLKEVIGSDSRTHRIKEVPETYYYKSVLSEDGFFQNGPTIYNGINLTTGKLEDQYGLTIEDYREYRETLSYIKQLKNEYLENPKEYKYKYIDLTGNFKNFFDSHRGGNSIESIVERMKLDENNKKIFKELGLLPFEFDEKGIEVTLKKNKQDLCNEILLSKNYNVEEIFEKVKRTYKIVNKAGGTLAYRNDSKCLGEGAVDLIRYLDSESCPNINTGIWNKENLLKLKQKIIPFYSKYFISKNEQKALEVFLTSGDISRENLIMYKKMGIIPLNIKNGIDVDTKLPEKDFNPNIMNVYRYGSIKEKNNVKENIFKQIIDEEFTENELKVSKENTKLLGSVFDKLYDKYIMYVDVAVNNRAALLTKEQRKYRDQIRLNTKKGEFNSLGEFYYKGKYYRYNPETGKMSNGKYCLDARNNRGFNPDHTYKDTGEYYDEKGLDYRFVDKEGFNHRTQFDKKGFYYKKDKDGNFVNTGLKYNPSGFMVSGIHVITHDFYDPRGFNINGECKNNDFKDHDKYGFKADGTHISDGKKFHNGYNAYGVDRNGKDRKGNTHPSIITAKEYIAALLNGKHIDYLNKKYSDKKYGTKSFKEKIININTELYIATKMNDDFNIEVGKAALNFMSAIRSRKNKIAELSKAKEKNKNDILRLTKEIESLERRRDSLDPIKKSLKSMEEK